MLLERKLLDLAFGKVKFSVIAALLLASLIVTALWSVIEHQRLLAWLAGIAGVKVLHILYLHRYKRHGNRADVDPNKWKAGLVAGAAATGLGWGSAVFCFPSTPFNPLTLFGVFVLPSTPFDPVTVLLIFILAGVTAYASVALAFVPLAAFAFFACAWLPLAIWLFSFGEQMYVVMGLIALSYLGVMVMLSRRMHATVRSLISVSEENRGLRTAQQENDWRMQRFFESAPGFFYTACMTPDGKSFMPFASAGIVELFDVAAEAVTDSMSPLFAVVHMEDIERIIKAREASRRNLSPFRIEFRVNHRIRGERWIELNSMPQREPDGTTNWHGFMQDITERRRLEESLAASEREFRTLAENFPDVVIRYDLDGRRTYVNRALAELAGTEPDEMLGKFREDTPLVDPEAYTAELRRAISTRDAALLEVSARGANGEVSWYQARFVPEFDADNKVSGVLMVAGDITARKRMEEELRLKEYVLDNAHDGVYLLDEHACFVYVNDQACHMLGYSRSELLGMGVGDIDYAMSNEDSFAVRKKSLEEGAFTFETQHRRRDGSLLPVEVRASTMVYQGKHLGLALARDITETHRQQQQQAQFFAAVPGLFATIEYRTDGSFAMPFVSDGAREVYGLEPEAIMQDIGVLMTLDHPDDAPMTFRKTLESARDLTPFHVEFRINHPSKGVRWLEARSMPQRLPDGGTRWDGFFHDITERKAMEIALHDSEKMLQAAQRIAHVGSWDVDMVNDKLVWSDEIFRIWEIDKTKFKADFAAFIETVHPEDRERVAQAYNDAVINNALYEVEHRLLFPDGRVKHILERGEPQYDAYGKPVRFIGTSLDITERKLAQQQLLLLETAISHSTDAIYLVDTNMCFRFVNTAACRSLGYSPEELLGMDLFDIDPLITQEKILNWGAILAAGAKLPPIESLHRARDGREFPVEVSSSQVKHNGEPFVISVVRDITERKKMELALQASERDFRSLAENMPDNIARWDVEGRYLYVNPVHERLLGVAASEVIGQPLPDTHEHVKSAFAQVVASGQAVELVRQTVPVNGELQSHEVTLVPEFDAAGRVVSVLGLGRNMTEFYRLQDEIAARERDFRSLAESSPDSIIRYDMGQHILYLNDALRRDLDLDSVDEVIGRRPIEVWPDGRFALIDEAASRVVVTGCAETVELVRNELTGPVRIGQIKVVPEFGGDRKVIGIIAFGRDITAIREAEQRQSQFFDVAPGFFYTSVRQANGQNVMPFASPGIRDLFGLEPADVVQGSELLLAQIHPDDREQRLSQIEESARNLTRLHYECRVNHPQRGVRWIEAHSLPQRLPDGSIRWDGFMHDITARKQAELALRESGEKLRNLYEYSPVGIALTDMNGRYIEFNEAFRAICGYSHDELMALDYWTLTPREYEAQEMAQMDALEKTGRYGPYVKEYVRRDGSRVPIQLNGALIIGKDMKPYIWSIVEDITERKRTEAQLKDKLEHIIELNNYLEKNARTLEEQAVELEASQDQLKEALEFSNGVINAIPDILFEMDLDGRYRGIWTQQPELLAAQKAALLNKTVYEVLPPETAEAAMAGIREAMENEVAYGQVLSITGADGVERWFEHSISRKQGGSPSDTRFIVLSRDVTERQRTEDVLRFIAQGEWLIGGEAFPDALVRYLGKSLGVDYVVIDKFADEPGYVETVARYAKGEIVQNVRYALQSTPCGEVAAGAQCCHGENIQRLFPDASLLKDMQVESYVGIPLLNIEGSVVGLIAVLNEQPLGGSHFVKSILQMVAPSAAAELERSRMEQVLRENYDALNEAQRISHVGNWELDLASGALLWSDEIYRIFEIDQERFGASYEAFLNAIYPDDRDAVSRAYEKSLETRAPYEIEHRLLFADGRIKYVHERCETRYAEDGKPLRSLGTVQDITARKQAEESLRESYARITELNRHLEINAVHLEENARSLEEQTIELEASQEQLKESLEFTEGIINAIPDILFEVDREGRYLNVWTQNPAVQASQQAALIGKTLSDILPEEIAAMTMEGIRKADEMGVAYGLTIPIVQSDGEIRWYEHSLSKKRGGTASRTTFIVLSRDVTDRQAMEAARETALAEAQRLAQLRSAFMAQMSHELRTPLNGILGYTQNLLQGGALGEKQVAGLNIIQYSGEHLLSLINGLLDHAAIEAGKFELVPDDIELDPFLSAIIGIIRVRVEQKNLAFICEAGSNLPAVVRGDAQRLRQVLINLLANAVKFTDSGVVILRVRLAAATRMRFEVQDSGIGIAADQLENIFQPYEQTGELQRRAGGSGLGLAISRTLVKLMGGDIRVESRIGEGSTFSFEIEIGIVESGRAGLDAAALSKRAETRVSQASPMMLAPPRQELDILHALALRGSMRDVTRHADRLAEADARYQPFAAQLRRLAQSFQTKALLGLIEQYRNREQEK